MVRFLTIPADAIAEPQSGLEQYLDQRLATVSTDTWQRPEYLLRNHIHHNEVISTESSHDLQLFATYVVDIADK